MSNVRTPINSLKSFGSHDNGNRRADRQGDGQGMSFGKKLTIAFVAMLVALIALGSSSWLGINSLTSELDIASGQTAKKLEIVSDATTNVTQLLSLERGILLRVNLKDMAKAREYHDQYLETAKALGKEIAELKPLLIREQAKKDAEAMESKLG